MPCYTFLDLFCMILCVFYCNVCMRLWTSWSRRYGALEMLVIIKIKNKKFLIKLYSRYSPIWIRLLSFKLTFPLVHFLLSLYSVNIYVLMLWVSTLLICLFPLFVINVCRLSWSSSVNFHAICTYSFKISLYIISIFILVFLPRSLCVFQALFVSVFTRSLHMSCLSQSAPN